METALTAAPSGHDGHNRDHGDGSDTTLGQPGDTKNAKRTLHITMSDTMRFTLATIKAKQGDTVKFLVTNIGKIKHEMVIDTQAELQEHTALMRRSSCSDTSLSPSSSAYHIAEPTRPELRQDIAFFSVDAYDQTLPFYIKRAVTMVAYKNELGFGIAHEPEKFIADLAAFEPAWRAALWALALMPPHTYREFLGKGLPMRLVGQDTCRTIVAKPWRQ